MDSFEEGWEELKRRCPSVRVIRSPCDAGVKAAFYAGMAHAIHLLVDREPGDVVGLANALERLSKDREPALRSLRDQIGD